MSFCSISLVWSILDFFIVYFCAILELSSLFFYTFVYFSLL